MEFIKSNSKHSNLKRICAVRLSEYRGGIKTADDDNEFMNFQYKEYGNSDKGNSPFWDEAVDHDKDDISRVFLVLYLNDGVETPTFSYDNHLILGYFSLAPTALYIEDEKSFLKMKLPAIELVEFAKNDCYSDMFSEDTNFYLGVYIFNHLILMIIREIRKYIGIKMIVMYAADEIDGTLVKHYEKEYNFMVLNKTIDHSLLNPISNPSGGEDKFVLHEYARVNGCTPMFQVITD